MSGLFDDQPNNQLMPSDTLSVEVVQPEQQTLEEQREPLSQEELHLRLHLERKVERAFYEAGKALQSLRDRRLYRSTHKNFEEYCRDRFGFERRHPYRLIDAADVVDNLAQMCPNGTQTEVESNQNQMCPNGLQILPTSDTNS